MVVLLKKFITASALIALSLLVAIIISEFALKMFLPQPLYTFDKNLFMNSSEYGYFLTPNIEKVHSQPEYSYIIKSNSYGFRGKEPDFKADNRVLILGDSYGMGQGVEEGKNLCDLSQRYFSRTNSDVDIFNTSVLGYGGINQVQVLRKYITAYNPDLVILLFYWNDIGMQKSLKVENGYLVLNAGNKLTAPLREWLNTHSHLYCLVKKFYYIYFKSAAVPGNEGGAFTDSAALIALKYVKTMKDICDQNLTDFVTVLIPWEGASDGSIGFRRSKAKFIQKLNSYAIPFEDWSLVLPKSNRQDFGFKIDHHWTEFGHEYFSNYLNQLILDHIKTPFKETQQLATSVNQGIN
jgi:hypothetical protein